jgi:hypothetical protein
MAVETVDAFRLEPGDTLTFVGAAPVAGGFDKVWSVEPIGDNDVKVKLGLDWHSVTTSTQILPNHLECERLKRGAR